jgi:hypothetical protein
MARGAQRGAVPQMFIFEGAVILAGGLLFGLLLAAGAGKLLSGILCDAGALHPLAFTIALLALAAAALLATAARAPRDANQSNVGAAHIVGDARSVIGDRLRRLLRGEIKPKIREITP